MLSPLTANKWSVLLTKFIVNKQVAWTAETIKIGNQVQHKTQYCRTHVHVTNFIHDFDCWGFETNNQMSLKQIDACCIVER